MWRRAGFRRTRIGNRLENHSVGSDIGSSVADLQKTLPKAQVKDGLLANSTGGIDGWLKDNGVMK